MGCTESKSKQQKEKMEKGKKLKKHGIHLDINQDNLDESGEKDKIFPAKTPAARRYEGPKKKEDEETASSHNIELFYRLGRVMGSGSFGKVRLANSKQEGSRNFAIKTIAKERMGEKAYMLRRELEILKTLDHPNVIKFYEIFHDKENFHFVMEYCSGGDIYNHIQEKGFFGESYAANVMHKIFSAVAHMHSKDVIHRDLKPENLMFSSKREGSEIKIIDFGLSRIFQPDFLKSMPSVVGTPLYVAPEVIEETYYGKECDNWSLGVVTYFILCGKEPFFARNIGEVYKKIRTADFKFIGNPWGTITKEARDLISKLLIVDPKNRMTAKQALQHPWFKLFVNKNKLPTQIELKELPVQQYIQNIYDNQWYKPQARFRMEITQIILNHFLTNTELTILQNVYRLIDLDKNGEISYLEVLTLMKQMGMDSPVQQKQMRNVFINLHENPVNSPNKDTKPQDLVLYNCQFMRGVLNLREYAENEVKLEQLFKFFDSSLTGEITLADLKEVVAREGRKLQDQELQNYISQIFPEGLAQPINIDIFKLIMIESDQEQLRIKVGQYLKGQH